MTTFPGEEKLLHAAALAKKCDELNRAMNAQGLPNQSVLDFAMLAVANALVGIGEMLSDARRQDVEETEAYQRRLAERDGAR